MNNVTLVALIASIGVNCVGSVVRGGDRPLFSQQGASSDNLEGWRPVSTGGGVPLATWVLRDERDAPAGGKVLALTGTNHTSTSAFNLCINERLRFKDGTFVVHFRADSGKEDQGGGPVWRVQDENNYYVCRANPLEDNFRLYVVTNGVRKQLASVDAKHATGRWHSIEVTHVGDAITCVLDGRARVEAKDASIPGEGSVGAWTKADAKTSFVTPWLGANQDAAVGAKAPLDTAAIERVAGMKGTLFEKEPGSPVFKLTQGRSDVPISVEGRRMEPFMGFTSWAAFRVGEKKPAMFAGDLVVFQDEVGAVMDALFDHGCTVTALHNHFFYEEPRTYFLHFGGEGTAEDLAGGFKAALDAIKSVRAATPDPRAATGFGGAVAAAANTISATKLDAVFFADGSGKGAVKDGMYKATIGRTVSMACGCEIGKEMGVNTWAGFCGNDESAAVAGDFVAFAGELQPVLHALRKAGINIVTIHSHMEGETPPAIFLHFWGKGRAEDLAKGVQSALETQRGASRK